MVDNRKISICVTSYNRDVMTVNSFQSVIDDERIGEVVIVDDCSKESHITALRKLATHPKIRMFVNPKNLGCYKNKKHAIAQALNEYVIIFDSDNTLSKDFIDSIFSVEWSKDLILAPEFARPHFNYTAFSGIVIDRNNVKQYIPSSSKTRFDCLINTMNYFVNRDEYLRVFDDSIEPWTADTIYQNYNWLKAGNKILVMPGMQYDHLVHDGSHYRNNVHHTGNLYKEIENRMMRL